MTKASDIVKALRKDKLDVALLSEDSSCNVDEWIPTGCAALDAIMGGGIPTGRYVEIYGDESTGKSLLAEQIAAEAQAAGCVVVYADAESAASIEMMQEVGVDTDNLVYFSPDTVEEVFETFDKAIDAAEKSGVPLVLIWDSIAATSAKFEMEADYGKAVMGNHARLISQSLRKITRRISKMQVAAVFINQAKENIGVMFGDKVATFGGKAVAFHASIRVKLDHSGKIKQKIEGKKKVSIIGIYTKATVVKNKVAVPYRDTILPIYFGHGIDDTEASYLYLKDMDILTVNGPQCVIEIDGEVMKFGKNKWAEIYEKHYDKIMEIMFGDDYVTEEAQQG